MTIPKIKICELPIDANPKDLRERAYRLCWISLAGEQLTELLYTASDESACREAYSELKRAVPESDFEECVKLMSKAKHVPWAAPGDREQWQLELTRQEMLQPISRAVRIARGTDNFVDLLFSNEIEMKRTKGQCESMHMPDLIHHGVGDWLVFRDTGPLDVPPMTRRSIIEASDDPWSDKFLVTAVSEVKRRRVPHLQWCDKVYALDHASPVKGFIEGVRFHIGWWRGRFWAKPNRPFGGPEEERLRFVLGRAFSSQYEWQARISMPGPFGGLTIPTSATNARDLFATRDRAPGVSRRAALLHWVKSHTRRSRANPNEEREVRAHLRGIRKFSWNGFGVELSPPKDDQ